MKTKVLTHLDWDITLVVQKVIVLVVSKLSLDEDLYPYWYLISTSEVLYSVPLSQSHGLSQCHLFILYYLPEIAVSTTWCLLFGWFSYKVSSVSFAM